jgi:hypothetical protein
MDLVVLDGERDMVVGQAARILLGHAGHREQWTQLSGRLWGWIVHTVPSSS